MTSLRSSLSPQASQSLDREKLQRAIQRSRKYAPRGAAAALRDERGREVLLAGPAGTGKSRGVLEWIDTLAWQYPGLRVLIARKTRASLAESALYTFEEFVLPPESPLRDGPQRQYRHSYDYPNGSQIILGGLDKPTRLFSTEFDIVYIPESIEATLNDWESLLRCLRHNTLPWQQLIGDTNPAEPTHWLKARCDAHVTKMLQGKHEDNPRLWDAEKGQWTEEGLQYIAILDALTGARKQRLRYGLWAQAEGAVYEGFDPAVHILNRFTIPASWRRIRVIDFGYTNPFVCLWIAIDHDGRMYVYRQIYMSQVLVEDHARKIVKLSAGERIEATITDHDAEDRATLEKHGVPTIAAQKAISVGIQYVQARLRKAGNGKPRFFILRDSLVERDEAIAAKKKPCCIEDEFPSYVWPKAADGKAIKEAPVDEYNHAMDAVRYGVMYLDKAQPMTTAENPFYGEGWDA